MIVYVNIETIDNLIIIVKRNKLQWNGYVKRSLEM